MLSISSGCWSPIGLVSIPSEGATVVRPAILDGDVLALDESGLAQAVPKRADNVRRASRCRAPQEPDHRHRRLLCARRERPHGGRSAERSYQFPPSDSDRHVALPCKGWLVKATISRRKRAVCPGNAPVLRARSATFLSMP